ncbi:DUF937 domain-containing protein [Sinosporangium siamense]|uniref:DUF937 domain-containing protein n=1 Tax=Sinosporangium siamense TaxID=1367973 RepID=A0A919V668_9ACTN|nr:DUF937 domain-containing protein [Sinosporangium siamense]GII91696.1 hypothetical protein Ssi02_19270 [Sinosporangium siamense]
MSQPPNLSQPIPHPLGQPSEDPSAAGEDGRGSLQDELFTRLGESGLHQIALLLDTGPSTARGALAASLGALVGGMARNCATPEGSSALHRALNDHLGRNPFSGPVASLTEDPEAAHMLGHILGGQGTVRAAQGIARFTAVNSARILKLLMALAPMTMSMLAHRSSTRNMDAGTLARDLDRELRIPEADGLDNVLSALLDDAFPSEEAIPIPRCACPQGTAEAPAPDR